MKTLLLRFNDQQFKNLMEAYKQRLISGDYLPRSEFVRQLLEEAIKNGK